MIETKESLNKKLTYFKRRLYRQKKKLEKLDMFKNSDTNFIQYRYFVIYVKKRIE
jgi:hypothetical protein